FSASAPRRPLSALLPYTTLFRSSTEGPRRSPHLAAFAPGPQRIARLARLPAGAQLGHANGWNPRATVAASRNCGATGRSKVAPADRKSTRLNSSHVKISYAVFCL